MEPTAEKNYSKLEWLFFMVIVPVLFISILTVILLWFLDVDVKEKVLNGLNQVPVIEKLIPDVPVPVTPVSTSNTSSTTNPQLEKAVADLKTNLGDKDSQIKQLQTDIANKDLEITQLKQQIKDILAQNESNQKTNQNQQEEWSNLAKIYANMNPKNAANIIANLEVQQAAKVLSQMSVESQSLILEKMDPKVAAKLSTNLKSMTVVN